MSNADKCKFNLLSNKKTLLCWFTASFNALILSQYSREYLIKYMERKRHTYNPIDISSTCVKELSKDYALSLINHYLHRAYKEEQGVIARTASKSFGAKPLLNIEFLGGFFINGLRSILNVLEIPYLEIKNIINPTLEQVASNPNPDFIIVDEFNPKIQNIYYGHNKYILNAAVLHSINNIDPHYSALIICNNEGYIADTIYHPKNNTNYIPLDWMTMDDKKDLFYSNTARKYTKIKFAIYVKMLPLTGGKKMLKDYTVKELKDKCRARKIKHSGLRKAELIKALRI